MSLKSDVHEWPVLFPQVISFGGFIKGILRGVRCTKSLRVLFLHRRPPSWTTLVLYSRAVFIFNEPAFWIRTKKFTPPPASRKTSTGGQMAGQSIGGGGRGGAHPSPANFQPSFCHWISHPRQLASTETECGREWVCFSFSVFDCVPVNLFSWKFVMYILSALFKGIRPAFGDPSCRISQGAWRPRGPMICLFVIPVGK